jgi:hypothetical protein
MAMLNEFVAVDIRRARAERVEDDHPSVTLTARGYVPFTEDSPPWPEGDSPPSLMTGGESRRVLLRCGFEGGEELILAEHAILVGIRLFET